MKIGSLFLIPSNLVCLWSLNTCILRAHSLSYLNRHRACKPLTSVSRYIRKMSSLVSSEPMFVLDPFGKRQFNNPEYTGTKVLYDEAEFERKINEYFSSGQYPLVDGYAPFW